MLYYWFNVLLVAQVYDDNLKNMGVRFALGV